MNWHNGDSGEAIKLKNLTLGIETLPSHVVRYWQIRLTRLMLKGSLETGKFQQTPISLLPLFWEIFHPVTPPKDGKKKRSYPDSNRGYRNTCGSQDQNPIAVRVVTRSGITKPTDVLTATL